MKRLVIELAAICVMVSASSCLAQGSSAYDSDLSHLPDVVRRDIESWQERLRSASCMKVVIESDVTWRDLYHLDEQGNPVIKLREHYQIHLWMTPDMEWMVIFPYDGDIADTSIPHYQHLWRKEAQAVWERAWMPEAQAYRASKQECLDPLGPDDGTFPSRSCAYAIGLGSWLAGGPELAERGGATAEIGLLRSPHLAIIPPDPSQSGVWLDVFDPIVRDEDPTEARLYRRNDCMLLARNAQGEPEVREWREIALVDQTSGGRKPQEMTDIERFSYSFFDSPPPELLAATDAFVAEIEYALTVDGSQSAPKDGTDHRDP